MSNLRSINLLKETLLTLAEQMQEIGKNQLSEAERRAFGQLAGLIEITIQQFAVKESQLNEVKFQYSTTRNDFVTEAVNCQTFEDVLDLVVNTKTTNPEFWPEAINLARMFFNKPLRHPEQMPDEVFLGNFFTNDLSSYKDLLEYRPYVGDPEVIAASLPSVYLLEYRSRRIGKKAYSVNQYNGSYTSPVIPYLRPVFVNKKEFAKVKNSIQE